MSNLLRSISLIVTAVLISYISQVIADEFPESFIKKQLEEAQKNVIVDTGKLGEGELLRVAYVGRPVWIYHRTSSDLVAIANNQNFDLADLRGENLVASIRREYGSSSSAVWARLLLLSQSIANNQPYRSIDNAFLVVGGWSSESGCALSFINDPKKRPNPAVLFIDPCTGARFDPSGRVLRGELSVPSGFRRATYNLSIPPYRIEPNGKIVIGPSLKQNIPELNFSRDNLYPEKEPTKLLIAAARYNDIDTIQSALKQGAKADFYKIGEGSPIDAAIIGSSIDVIKLLITHGARATPNSYKTAKFINREEVIELLKLTPNSN
jgi:ubiquinol-cytochrome c reductase iron-sulfur subunit